ncbi:uncharacterized protein LOC118204105 [Stegodyphus dumicola]|uniref:uncharacterized protein LOC118204105 n=1 Tax=Stegodyphus dumicola TaxID=202533 RepID=UPI0015ADCC4D|nr:uncharacterized protein LOC118204105 [Stegodyphus dumicola]
MNKTLACLFLVMLCTAMAMATYRKSYHGGHKIHLGGAGYAYRPSYAHSKPVLHHAPVPVVYARKSHSKPHVTHYVKPSYHHSVPHAGYSKPVYYLGGHASHGVAHKPAVYASHGYAYKPAVHAYAPHAVAYAHKSYPHH